jgi:hypothetical protein
MMTRVRRINATNTADPEKKSRTFVATLKTSVGAEIRAAEVIRIRPISVLELPSWKSPQFNGRIFLK